MKKYQIVAKELLEKINNDHYPDKKLPIEDELVKEYGASKNTIRNATDLLVERGLLYRVQGSGVYIRRKESDHAINANLIRGVNQEFKGHSVKTKLLSLDLVESDAYVSGKLGIAVGSPIYHIRRVRYVDDNAITFEDSYYNKNVIPYIGEEIAKASIYQYIENDLKLKIGFADKYVSVALLNDEVANTFNQSIDQPTLIIKEKVYLSNGTLFNYSEVHHNYQHTELFISANN